MPRARELVDIRASEVSAVDKAANRRRFLVTKREAGDVALSDAEIAAVAAEIVRLEAAKAATCPKCGAEMADAAKFCPECGADMAAAGGAPEKTKEATVALKIEKRDAGYVVEGLEPDAAAEVAKRLDEADAAKVAAETKASEATAKAAETEKELLAKAEAEEAARWATESAKLDRLPGAPAERAALLQRIAKADAETGKAFLAYFGALNETLKTAGVTAEIGKEGRDAVPDEPFAALSQAADALIVVAKAAGKAMTREAALKAAVREHPDLYRAYTESTKRGRK